MQRLILTKLSQLAVTQSTAWLLDSVKTSMADCARRRPTTSAATAQRLATARVHSVESSNRIEGVTVDRRRLIRLVMDSAAPKDRSEEEISGYNSALSRVLDGSIRPPLTPSLLQQLHRIAQGGELPSDAGEWKQVNNDIVAWDQRGNPSVLFRPPSWQETPGLVDALCREWQLFASGAKRADPLLLSATVVLDFLAVHPFRDGNGRVSRLLTTMLLIADGHSVLREVSHERLIERRREDYYQALKSCTETWGRGATDPSPWWNYFLGILRDAYREAELEPDGPAITQTERVALAIEAMPGDFTLGELLSACPGVGEALAKLVLQQQRKAGQIALTGKGRGARWRKVSNLGPG